MDTAMGTFFHPITIIGARDRETIDALVDPDHLFSILPYGVLARLDFWPDRSHNYHGHERGFGQVQAGLLHELGWITYVVAADDEQPRIGSHTLESFGLEIDQENEKLVPKTFRLIQHV